MNEKEKLEQIEKDKLTEKSHFRQMMMASGVVIFTCCVVILFYFIVERYQGFGEGWGKIFDVLQAIIIGFVMAFLTNPIMKFFERHMMGFFLKHSKTEEKARKTVRGISAVLATIVLVGLIVLFFVAVVPELYSTFYYFATHMDQQISEVLDWANDITGGRFEEQILGAKNNTVDELIENATDWVTTNLEIDTEEITMKALNGAYGLGRFIFNALVGLIVSIYILCSKETFKGQAKKLLFGIFKPETANIILEIGRKTDSIFYGFIIGKIIDSAIIGAICYVCMLIMGMPYPVLCSIIVGVTNVIPVFGPYIGAVPTVIIIFLTEPMQGIYFLIFIIILQQIDGNIIGPKILGDSTGLSAFWVVVAIVVGGGLFGLPGMLLGVPTTALIYYLVGRFSKYLLRRRGLPEETSDYINADHVDTETKTVIQHEANYEETKKHFTVGKKKLNSKKDSNEESKS